jgi:nucleoside 2-deoxyribosyltransferase
MCYSYRIFISYAFDDTDAYNGLVNELKRYIAFKNNSIRKHDKLNDSDEAVRALIYKKISESDIVILLVDNIVFCRPWIKYEMRTATELEKPVLGIYKNREEYFPPGNLDEHIKEMVDWDIERIIAKIKCLVINDE